jgi:hypothetical protein
MKIKEVKKYIFEDGNSIEMIPVKNLPGVSHRIAVNGVLVKSWLFADFRPNQKSAQFFYDKHIVQNELEEAA